MHILYYLEPWVELSNPFFRLGTIKNHIRNEIASLHQSGATVTLFAREDLIEEAKARKLIDPDTVNIVGVSLSEVQKIAPNYSKASDLLWKTDQETVEKLRALLKSKTDEHQPDVVIAYETSSSEAIREIFPDSLVIDSSLGGFSRDPYPETFCYDTGGALNRALHCERPKEFKIGTTDHVISQIREHYRRRLADLSPFDLKQIRRQYRAICLLPLQVSPYFVFNQGLPNELHSANQFDLLLWFIEKVPQDIAVIVTEHGAQLNLTQANTEWLRKKYPNFIFLEDTRNHKWSSQFIVPEVDGVVTVSSSLAVQAALYGKAVHVIAENHLHRVSTHSSIEEFFDGIGEDYFQDNNIKDLMARFYTPTVDVAWSQDWLLNRFSALQKDPLDYPGVDDATLLRWYVGASRHQITSDAVKSSKDKKYSLVTKHTAAHNQVHTGADLPTVKKKIQSAEIVSFDVFDTLIGRKVDDPSKVWEITWQRFTERFNPKVFLAPEGFAEKRKAAARSALHRARADGKEDVKLGDIYRILTRDLGLNDDAAVALRKIEIEVEKALTFARAPGVESVNFARELGKTIAYVSDIYIDARFLLDILRAHGVPKPDIFLVSADEGLLKKTGKLFDRLIAVSKTEASKILHIGDNTISDAQMAVSRGIQAAQIPAVGARFSASSAYANVEWGRCTFSSFVKGTIASKFFDDWSSNYNRKSLFKGSARRMGYCAAGPIMTAFTLWIARRVLKDGVKRVFFLARDGRYPFEIYKMLREVVPSLPEASYVRASRRACNIAAISSVADLNASLELAFSTVQLNTLLKDRFEYSLRGKKEAVLSAGFSSTDQQITSKNPEDLEKLRRLFEIIGHEVVENCRKEGDTYKSYLRSVGFYDVDIKSAVVDIGHNGTLQDALIRLTERELDGYYFSTFHKATEVAISNGCHIDGFLLDYNPQSKPHFYSRNIGMFEFLFLPNENSLKRVTVDEGGGFAFDFVEYSEKGRLRVSQEVSKGTYDFARDAIGAFGKQILELEPTAADACAVYRSFIEAPTDRDIEIVKGVYFADAFGGSHKRYLIDERHLISDDLNKDNFMLASWWKAGAKVRLAQIS